MSAPQFLGALVATDLICAGGSLRCEIPDLVFLKVSRSILNPQTISLRVPRQSPAASELVSGAVVILEYDDASTEEWRIYQRTSVVAIDGMFLDITAGHPSRDLGENPELSANTTAGTPSYTNGGVDLTPTQYIDAFIIGDPNCPAWISRGTIDPTLLLTLTFDHVTPLAAIQQIVTAVVTNRIACEFQFRKVGNTGYAIDLVSQIGSGAASPTLSVGLDLARFQEFEDATDQATVARAYGASQATMKRAAWAVAVVDSTHLTLSDPAGGAGPLLCDGQLNSKYIVRPDTGALIAISASIMSTQRITVTSTTGFTTGDLCEIKADASGNMLDVLTVPGTRVKYGTKSDDTFVGDYNTVPNPFQNAWANASGAADGYTFDGTYTAGGTGLDAPPTFAFKQTSPAPTYGKYGVHIQANGAAWNLHGLGIFGGSGTPSYSSKPSPWMTKTTDDSQISAKVRIAVTNLGTNAGVRESIRVQLERVGSGFGAPVAIVDSDVATANGTTIELGFNAVAMPSSGQFYLRVFQKDIGARSAGFDITIQEFQITQTPANVAWLAYSGGNRIWALANLLLSTNGSPTVQYTAQQVERARLDPVGYAHTVVALGATCTVLNEDMNEELALRCIGIDGDLKDQTQQPTLTFGAQPKNLTQMLALDLLRAA